MKSFLLRAAALGLAGTLGACSTIGGGGPAPAEVTRFHLGQPIARGQIAVEPINAADGNSLEFSWHQRAVEQELARLGWTVVQTVGQSEQVALINVEQGSRQAIAQRSPVSIGVGGSTGGWGSGLGAGISFGLGGGGSKEIVATLLEVSIRRRSDSTVFWEGRAQTEARVGQEGADPRAAVQKLSAALFQDFPGESGRTITVR